MTSLKVASLALILTLAGLNGANAAAPLPTAPVPTEQGREAYEAMSRLEGFTGTWYGTVAVEASGTRAVVDPWRIEGVLMTHNVLILSYYSMASRDKKTELTYPESFSGGYPIIVSYNTKTKGYNIEALGQFNAQSTHDTKVSASISSIDGSLKWTRVIDKDKGILETIALHRSGDSIIDNRRLMKRSGAIISCQKGVFYNHAVK